MFVKTLWGASCGPEGLKLDNEYHCEKIELDIGKHLPVVRMIVMHLPVQGQVRCAPVVRMIVTAGWEHWR